jgi:hypothetical protein
MENFKSKGKISDIQYFDNCFSPEEFTSMYGYLCNQPKWKFGAKSRPDKNKFMDEVSGISDGDSTMFWRMELSDDKYFSEYIFSRVKEITNSDWDIEMIYANGQTFGQGGSLHIDHPDGYTFLIYNNIHWDLQWGGKTFFVDEDEETSLVFPIPNRAILFPGTIYHYAESPTRQFKGLRITTAYKLFPKK